MRFRSKAGVFEEAIAKNVSPNIEDHPMQVGRYFEACEKYRRDVMKGEAVDVLGRQ